MKLILNIIGWSWRLLCSEEEVQTRCIETQHPVGMIPTNQTKTKQNKIKSDQIKTWNKESLKITFLPRNGFIKRINDIIRDPLIKISQNFSERTSDTRRIGGREGAVERHHIVGIRDYFFNTLTTFTSIGAPNAIRNSWPSDSPALIHTYQIVSDPGGRGWGSGKQQSGAVFGVGLKMQLQCHGKCFDWNGNRKQDST